MKSVGDLRSSGPQIKQKKSRGREKVARTAFRAALMITWSRICLYGVADLSSIFESYVYFFNLLSSKLMSVTNSFLNRSLPAKSFSRRDKIWHEFMWIIYYTEVLQK